MALSNRQLGKAFRDKVDERSILGGVGRLTLQTFPEFEKMPLQNAEDVVMSPRVTALSEGNATSIQDMAAMRERERERETEERWKERR